LIQHLIYILWFFSLGACVGSFLNVVVWRLPRGESIVSPPSRCPYCEHRLAWYDNVPIFGWLALRGRCRYCHNPISAEYPTIEFITASIFAIAYVIFFIYHEGPCWMQRVIDPDFGLQYEFYHVQTIVQSWPLFVMALAMLACLLAGSLIDARHYFVPLSIPVLLTVVGLAYHTILDRPRQPGSLTLENPIAAAMAIGAGIGLVLSNLLLWKGWMKRSFAEGWPALEIDQQPQEEPKPGWFEVLISKMVEAYRRPLTSEQRKVMEDSRARAEAREKKLQEEFDKQAKETQPPLKEFTRADLRREMQREILFLLPPMLGGLIAASIAMLLHRAGNHAWENLLIHNNVLSGFAGSLMGALVGSSIIWIIMRLFGTLTFGREALGMGDVHLMFGIGAILGSAGSVIVFFVAPFAGILFALRKLIFGSGRELPYVPSLAVAAGVVMLFYCRFIQAMAPSMTGLLQMIHQLLGM
jgi:leader peptidase (prepilin peptidase)/N-methyltransferase